MPKILIADQELEAAEGPFGLKCWPPSALEPTLKAFRHRALRSRWVNFAGEIPAQVKGVHHRGRPKGGGLQQFGDNIGQRGHGGKR